MEKLEKDLKRIGTIEEIIKNEYFLYAIIANGNNCNLLETLFIQINKELEENKIKPEDLRFFREGKLIDAIINLRETTEIYAQRRPFKGERMFKLDNIATLKDLDTLIVCYTHPSIINALCGEGIFGDREELTYIVDNGTYNKLPKEVQMAIVSEVLKKGNIEVAMQLLETSVDQNKTTNEKVEYIVENGMYHRLPKEVQIAMVSEVLKKGNIEVAMQLLETSVDQNKTYKNKNNYIKSKNTK